MSNKVIVDSDSSEDDDYVPTAKDLKQAGVSDPDEPVAEKQLTGIALVKDQKRQREVDDIFAMMNEADDHFVNTNKRQKVDPVQKPIAKEITKPVVVEKEKLKEDTFNAALAAIQKMKQK